MSTDYLAIINEDKLPIKYVMGVEKDFDTYPDAFDIAYIQIKNIKRSPDRNKGNFTKYALLKYDVPDAKIENVEAGLKKAIELGIIECTNETIDKEAYRIILNPFA